MLCVHFLYNLQFLTILIIMIYYIREHNNYSIFYTYNNNIYADVWDSIFRISV